jgi:hypothetical protein
VQVILTLAKTGQTLPRTLLADSGAGSQRAGFELIVKEADCLLCGGNPLGPVVLGGTYAGPFQIFGLLVQVPALGFSQNLRVVGVPSIPAGFDGIACFRFINRFTYGNFGDPSQFGLEC